MIMKLFNYVISIVMSDDVISHIIFVRDSVCKVICTGKYTINLVFVEVILRE